MGVEALGELSGGLEPQRRSAISVSPEWCDRRQVAKRLRVTPVNSRVQKDTKTRKDERGGRKTSPD